MNKKGFFFILDIVFGLIILVIGLTALVSFYYQVPVANQFDLYTSDITSFFTLTKAGELNNNVTLDLIDSNIIDEDDYLGEVLASFCENKDSHNFQRLVGNTTNQIIAQQFNYNISILYLNDSTCLSSHRSSGLITQETSSVKTSSRVLLYGMNDTYDPQGPYVMEVVLW